MDSHYRRRLEVARAGAYRMLAEAEVLPAPRRVVDELCRWIQELERELRRSVAARATTEGIPPTSP